MRSQIGPFNSAFLCVLCGLIIYGPRLAAKDLPPAPEPATGFAAAPAATAKHFMVAAANPLAVAAGVQILKQGGNALDAAIATQMVLNLVEPQSSGIGGGGFLLYYSAQDKRLYAYDGRETAPAAAKPDMFLDGQGKPLSFYDAVVGGKSVGVPGLLAMLNLAHARHGKLDWAALFTPAIGQAEQGFAISPRLNKLIAADPHLAKQEAARGYFYRPDGSPRAIGETLKNPKFAALLRQIAQQGSQAFYQGAIARDLVASVRNHPTHPGTLSEDDLKGYRAKVREPVCGPYHDYVVCGMPPPSSGGITLLQILGMLQQIRLFSELRPVSTASAHLFSEAGRLAYADRNRYLADSDFVPVPVRELTDPRYLATRSRLIQLNRSMGKAQPGTPLPAVAPATIASEALELPATSHLTIVDAHGNAVAMTSSIENAFGSRILVHGFLLNNQLTDFAFQPTEDGRPVPNRIEPGKRPLSSMSPTVVFDAHGQLVGALGSPGGSAIINYVAQTLVGVIDWKLDIQQAMSLPHFGSRNGPTELEAGMGIDALRGPLEALGHEVKISEQNSGLHGIWRSPGGWSGGADPRREGVARGE